MPAHIPTPFQQSPFFPRQLPEPFIFRSATLDRRDERQQVEAALAAFDRSIQQLDAIVQAAVGRHVPLGRQLDDLEHQLRQAIHARSALTAKCVGWHGVAGVWGAGSGGCLVRPGPRCEAHTERRARSSRHARCSPSCPHIPPCLQGERAQRAG